MIEKESMNYFWLWMAFLLCPMQFPMPLDAEPERRKVLSEVEIEDVSDGGL